MKDQTMRQESDNQMLSKQERLLQFDKFDRNDAWRLADTIRRICEERSVALSIEIRLAKETVFFYSMPGTTPNNANWVRRKRNVVELLQQSSYACGDALEREGVSLQDKHGLCPLDYAAFGGSFPINVSGCGCIGVVTVSGIPQREDHAIVVQALATMCGVPVEAIAL